MQTRVRQQGSGGGRTAIAAAKGLRVEILCGNVQESRVGLPRGTATWHTHVGEHHAGRRRGEHVEGELLLLRLDEVRELVRNLGEGEDSVDIPARARDTPSLVRGARAVDAQSTEDARAQRGVGHARGRVEGRGGDAEADTRRLTGERMGRSEREDVEEEKKRIN